MGRKKNYSSEQLKRLVDEYVRKKADYSAMTATEIASFCTSHLHLVPGVTYQTFTRDREVMDYIEHLNQTLHERMLVPSTKGAKANQNTYLTVSDGNADESSLTQKANALLSELYEHQEVLQHRLDNCKRELDAVRHERDVLKALNSDMVTVSASMKNELANLRCELKKEKHLNTVFKRYIQKYIYEPICLRHVTQLGWITDNTDSIRRCAVTADIVQEIQEAYEGMDNVLSLPGEEDKEKSAPIEPDTFDASPAFVDVVDTESEEFLSKLMDL